MAWLTQHASLDHIPNSALGFGLIIKLSLAIPRLLPRSIHVAERSIPDRFDVLGPVLSVRFCRFQRFMKPGIKMLSCCLSSIRSPKPEIPLLREF